MQCLGYGQFKSDGAARITNHLLGEGGSKKCSMVMADDTFKAALEKVKAARAAKDAAKVRKLAVAQVNAAAAGSTSSVVPVVPRQAGQPDTLNGNVGEYSRAE